MGRVSRIWRFLDCAVLIAARAQAAPLLQPPPSHLGKSWGLQEPPSGLCAFFLHKTLQEGDTEPRSVFPGSVSAFAGLVWGRVFVPTRCWAGAVTPRRVAGSSGAQRVLVSLLSTWSPHYKALRAGRGGLVLLQPCVVPQFPLLASFWKCFGASGGHQQSKAPPPCPHPWLQAVHPGSSGSSPEQM